MISVLSAVAEIERENIRVQTMEGRIQKAREGKWNGVIIIVGIRFHSGFLRIQGVTVCLHGCRYSCICVNLYFLAVHIISPFVQRPLHFYILITIFFS